MAAAYGVDISLSDDETPEFSFEWTTEDGSDFPWSDYTVTYALHRDGRCCWSCDYGWGGYGSQDLSQDAGITVDPTQNLITFSLTGKLSPGRHTHGCCLTHTATGKKLQLFDGTVTVSEGNFR